jgi:hypothetical protein
MTKLDCNAQLFDLIAELQIDIAENTGMNVSMEDSLLLLLTKYKNEKEINQGHRNQNKDSRGFIYQSDDNRERKEDGNNAFHIQDVRSKT